MTAPRVIKSLPIAPINARQAIHVGYAHEPEFVADGEHAPQVECIVENGIVRRIEIRCSCGQLTTLVCQYRDEAA